MFIKKLSKSLVLVAVAGLLAAVRTSAADTAAATTATNAAPTVPKAALNATDLFPDALVAKGKGVEVKRNQLDEEVIRAKAQFTAARGQPLPPEYALVMERNKLEELIQLQLLRGQATEADKSAAKVAVEKQLADARAQAGSDDSLNLRLKAQGLTREELVSKLTEMETAKATLVRELKISITDADVKKFYDENPAEFEEPEMVRASHILFSTKDPSDPGKELSEEKKAAKRKQAEDVMKRAKAGEDFAKLAKEYSEDPGSRDKGGEYTFPRGKMVKAFEDASFTLKTNEVSDLIATPFGYHIIKLSEKIPAKKRAMTDLTPRIKEFLTRQAISKQAPEFMEKLKKEAGVEILDERLKPQNDAEAAALPPGHPSVTPGHPPVTPGKKPESK